MEDVSGVELGDIGFGNPFLVVIFIEDDGAVLSSLVGALAVEFGGVVDDGEEHFEQLAVSDLGRVVGYLDGFGVAGSASANHFIVSGVPGAAGESGDGRLNALDMLEDTLDAPEAAAGKNGGLVTLSWG